MQKYLTAAVQLCAGTDKKANLDKAEALVAEAAQRGARLVALPEVFSWRGSSGDEFSGAEPVPGPTTERCAAWARTHRIYLLAGSIYEAIRGERKAHNTSLLFGPNGELLARYRKIHLFDVEIPGQVHVRESSIFVPGSEVVAVPTELGTIGLSVCYDLRFPELYRRLGRRGAQVVCAPSAFTFPTGCAHWEVLVRARAIENQVYVIAPDQVGTNPRTSLFAAPWGIVRARAPAREAVILAEVDLEYLDRVRRELPCLQHIQLER
jgi:predicted amidohydrolase